MPGVAKVHTKRNYGRAFPASGYDDPRGGRPSALERNVLRYRTTEAALYLFYAEEVRRFLLTDVHSAAVRKQGEAMWELPEERRLHHLLTNLLTEAASTHKLPERDVAALRLALTHERQQGKKLKIAFGYAIAVGIVTEVEAVELKSLLNYRNDIAHRIHAIMSDVSRSYCAIDQVAYFPPAYKGGALDRLQSLRRSLRQRSRGKLLVTVSSDGALFELAEHAFELDLKRLDRLITKQIGQDNERHKRIHAELDLGNTDLVDDLSPRFPANHRCARQGHGDDYIPATGHLTKRGVEICYRLFDLGKGPIAVAYLMGMTLRSAERRRHSWSKAGGFNRIRAEIERYDVNTMQRRPTAPCDQTSDTHRGQ